MVFLLLLLFLPPPISSLHVLIFPSGRLGNLATPSATFLNPPSTNFSDVSFCVWVKLDTLKRNPVLAFDLNETSGLGLALQEDYGFIKIKSVDLLFDFRTPALPRRWRHFCVVYKEAGQSATVYQEGKLVFRRENLTVLDGVDFHPELLSHLSWGETETLKKTVRPQKELTLGRVWGRALQPEEVIQEATCSGGAAGPLVDWPAGAEVLQLLHRGAGVLAVEKEGSCPLQWEDGEQRLVGFSQRLKFHEAGVKCKGLGGTQVTPTSVSDLEEMRESFPDIKKCSSNVFVPIKRQNGRWEDLISGRPAPFLSWKPGQPNGLHYQNCAEVKFDKETGEVSGFNDVNCNVTRRCFSCRLPPSQRFTLRGLCSDSGADTRFIGELEAGDENRPRWSGFCTSEISFSATGSVWQLKDRDTDKVLASVYAKFWPVGRHQWLIQDGVCGSDNHTRNLTLTSCSSSSSLTCSDGTCRPISNRCDGTPDCPDQGDELDCSLVEFPRTSQYRENLPPISRDKEGVLLPVQVSVDVAIQEVGGISETGMSFSSKLELRMTWYEKRVRWRNLRASQNLNRVPQFIPQVTQEASGNIWAPIIIFANSPLSDQTIVDQQAALMVERKAAAIPAPPEEAVEVAYYSGAENPVTYSRIFKNTFACVFDLKKYPFDTQVCKIQLATPKDVEGLVTLQPGDLRQLSPVDMMQFSLLDWKMTKTESGVEVTLVFKRRVQHHLLTTYLPTFCLMLVCQSGLYLRAEHFKTTAAISVTVMLVIYTLYQSVSNKVTPTAYIKLIDVWLIFGLVLPFVVFFLLVSIDHLPKAPSPASEKPQQLWKLRQGLIVFAHFVLPAIILVFALAYAITAALIFYL